MPEPELTPPPPGWQRITVDVRDEDRMIRVAPVHQHLLERALRFLVQGVSWDELTLQEQRALAELEEMLGTRRGPRDAPA